MSENIHHECGLALVRLRQPLAYYGDRYRDTAWGMRNLYLLMEKQHNRGQDGAGMAVVKFDMPPGEEYLNRLRSDKHNALEHLFDVVMRDIRSKKQQNLKRKSSSTRRRASDRELLPNDDAAGLPMDLALKRRHEYLGELYLGHLRYGTHAGHHKTFCHPLVRKNNTASRNLAIAGNFNMTNANELFKQLVEYGLNPVGESDTQVILERLGYFLDKEHEHLQATMGPESFRHLEGRELADAVSKELDIVRILSRASESWDGGYVFAALLGNGDAFICRDPAGIRPAYFYVDEEIVAAASERIALANVFNVDPKKIEPIKPGHVLVIKQNGHIEHTQFTEPLPLRQCTFERVYFSRGNDPDIYKERKALGRNLAPRVLRTLGADIDQAIFSYIPNTAEPAYMGLVEAVDELTREKRVAELWTRIESGKVKRNDLDVLANGRLRAEKIAHKDQRLRTFITHDAARRDLVMHIYDITRGIISQDDTLVVIDDSIVRGTTLRESIITILSRLNPKRIIIASSAPPIMYPDCYGIDMSQLGRFIAFEAAVALLNDRNETALLEDVEDRCRMQVEKPANKVVNHVALIYDRFTLEEISAKVAELVRPKGISWKGEIDIVYQTVEGLRAAMPNHTGDWYFTGDYPTPGGFKVLNRSFLDWRAKQDRRAYEVSVDA